MLQLRCVKHSSIPLAPVKSLRTPALYARVDAAAEERWTDKLEVPRRRGLRDAADGFAANRVPKGIELFAWDHHVMGIEQLCVALFDADIDRDQATGLCAVGWLEGDQVLIAQDGVQLIEEGLEGHRC